VDLGVRNHLSDIARLVPTLGISVDILEAVYPSGEVYYSVFVLD